MESTPAAEALSLQEAIAHGSYLRAVVAEIVDVDKEKIPIKAYTDSNNLFKAVYSTKLVKDRRLRIDMAQIHEGGEHRAAVDTGKRDASRHINKEGWKWGQHPRGDQGQETEEEKHKGETGVR